ncbi:DUF4440 domain-containing protein [Crocosphaera sp.]|uniref:DUF4440 domain-containing protein n=1 Tax=Crocosphaera sp. TaxID=2729996 RepID=UPI002618312F|nr:DUF4440 domain-containing protein [Crocosphaera sp.]MDJ0580490.1 DUF4440 domain-containing protein [Crocosphaera sp.]
MISITALLIFISPLSGFAQTEKAEKEVAETTDMWLNTVTSGSEEVVDEVVALYADDGILWGTVSEQVRDTPAEIRDYFEYFAKLPQLSVSSYKGCIRMYDDNLAINTGYYTFTYSKNGQTKEVPARYSFVYQKNGNNKWEIIEHHSSALPEAPEALQEVGPEQDACENGLLVQR